MLSFKLQMPPDGSLNHFEVTAIVNALTLVRLHPGCAQQLATCVDKDIENAACAALEQEQIGVIARYQSLSGNQPHTYKNSLALWNSLLPNLSAKPLNEVEIPTDSQTGDAFIPYELGRTDYCVTYQTGSLETMCALAQIRLGSVTTGPLLPLFVSIEIRSITTASISIFYDTLPGYRPATYKNWIGIWPGFALPYNAPPPKYCASINEDYTQGILEMPFSQIAKNYTMVYFTGPEVKNAAAVLYFEVNPAQ